MRLARELHNGPAQVLANAIFMLEYCQGMVPADQERLAIELRRLVGDLRAGLSEVRSFIFDLRPGPIAELGLAGALRRYNASFEAGTGIAVDLQIDEPINRLPAFQEVAIYRIVQEALRNVRRHSGASGVIVRLSYSDDALVAEVRDNGRGFDTQAAVASPGQRMGLSDMHDRAHLIGADLRVESIPTGGTSVRLHLPFERPPTARPHRRRNVASDALHGAPALRRESSEEVRG